MLPVISSNLAVEPKSQDKAPTRKPGRVTVIEIYCSSHLNESLLTLTVSKMK